MTATDSDTTRTTGWSIQELARAAGTTSRTLRYYGEVGLLAPSRVGANGYRYYDEAGLVLLQRILHLRELGLGIPAVARVLAGEQDTASALRVHLELLEEQRGRLERQIASVRTTLEKLERGETLMANDVLDGFDHAQYRDEVVERWGNEAWERSDRWHRSPSGAQRGRFQQAGEELARDYAAALEAGLDARAHDVQAIVRRHVEWLSAVAAPSREYLLGLAELYTGDSRFAAYYDRHAPGTAAFVRDALRAYVERSAD